MIPAVMGILATNILKLSAGRSEVEVCAAGDSRIELNCAGFTSSA